MSSYILQLREEKVKVVNKYLYTGRGNKMTNKYFIGEFSELTGISKRMLRHYDKIKLFSPIEINEDNGYRCYGENQIVELDKIQFLRKLGFTLSSIGEILAKPIGLSDFVELLKDREVSLTKESDDIKSSLLMTNRMINLLEKQSPRTFPSIHKLLDWERSITMTSEKQNKKGAIVDLKELMNRDMFMEKIEEILEHDNNDTYHFVTFDIDKFMHVNDFYGFEVGDLVIQNVMSLIVQNMKPLLAESINENLIARLGGDEFSIFLKNSDTQKVIDCVEMSLKEIRSFEYSTIGCGTTVTSSCGIAFGRKPVHIAKLQDQSAKALIDAKRNGRDQYLLVNY